MSRIIQAKRRRLGAKKLDMGKFAAVFEDRRTHCDIGIVQADDDGDHFEIDEETGEITIEVVLQPQLIPLTCRLIGPGGVWMVPAVGEEVFVLIPGGDLAGSPVCIPKLMVSPIPEDVGVDRIVIVRGKVYIHDGSGGATPLARAPHTHLDSNGMETSQAISGTAPNPAYDPMLPPGPSNPVNIATGTDGGTTVLEAK